MATSSGGPIGLATTDHDPLESRRLRGGQSVTGYLIFEAPEDATTWDLIFSPLNGSYVLGLGAFED
ncbi:MAG TPA: hypothetical protein VGT61_10030 [Thermomicrobiales bacterium]|jgi:hypothetical protein|nr:hypothetical protein [Thermomicrobiales bacterium]